MKCDKCGGCGMVDNKYYWTAKAKYNTDYYLRFSPSKKCPKCNGKSWYINNVEDVLGILTHLKVKFEVEKNKEYTHMVNQCIEIIKNT